MKNPLPPHLIAEWHPTENGAVKATEVNAGSSRFATWLCAKVGHVWDASIKSRAVGHNCPYCSNRRVLVGYNDLATTNPKLAKEWHPTKNGNLTPQNMTEGSKVVVIWTCKKNHFWPASPKSRKVAGCPVCSGQRIVEGINDLKTLNPKLAAEWHPTENENLSPATISPNSHMRVRWLGECTHEWTAQIKSRNGGRGCAYCANKKVLAGFNDLATIYPLIAAEWHPTKNGDLLPSHVIGGGRHLVWWQCRENNMHEWTLNTNERTINGSGCPQCYAHSFISKGETEVFDFISSLGFSPEQSNRKVLKGKELDIYIPELGFAVEYNGLYWHTEWSGKSELKHQEKWLAAKNAGITLVQVWEDDWRDRRALVERLLAEHLNALDKLPASPASTIVSSAMVPKSEADLFLASHHLLGPVGVNVENVAYLGVRDIDNIWQALIAVETKSDSVTIIRYATTGAVYFPVLLEDVKRAFPSLQVFGTVDCAMNNSRLFTEHGFVEAGVLPPVFQLFVQKWRKRVEDCTEAEQASLNRIWDAGSTLFSL